MDVLFLQGVDVLARSRNLQGDVVGVVGVDVVYDAVKIGVLGLGAHVVEITAPWNQDLATKSLIMILLDVFYEVIH